MKLTKLLSAITLLFPVVSVTAQQNYSVNAKVTDSKTQPIPVTARLLAAKDSSLITGALFEDGRVFLSGITDHQVHLKLTSLSFADTLIVIENNGQTAIELGTITMKEQQQLLNEVRIKGQIPIMQHGKNGSIEIQVPGTLLASSSTVAELLERSPGLSVADGSVTFIGKGDAIIFLNGRPVMYEQLAAIAVDQILKVEIIANPSSKYDAQGKAVVNMITKAHVQSGLLGSFTQQYSYTDFAGGESNTMADVNYSVNKVSLALVISVFFREITVKFYTQPEPDRQPQNTSDQTSQPIGNAN